MGRFYNVSGQAPQFIDGLYTPPWEMMDKALSYNQEGYDNALATTDLFENLDIQYIEDPIVKEQVQKIKDYYSGKINSISEAIKANPMDWKKSRVSIENLSKDLQENLKNGEIARIQKAAQSLSNFLEQHKDFRVKNPGDFNRAYQYFLKEYQKDPLRIGNFDWETLVNPIDIESINKRIKDMAANAVEKSDGRWIVGNEEVTRDRIMESARNQIFGDPANSAYIEQQIRFQNPDYYNEEYAKVNGGSGFYDRLYLDPTTGKVLSDEEATKRIEAYEKAKLDYFKKVNSGKKAEIPVPNVIQKNGAIGNLIESLSTQYAYSKQTRKPDSSYVASMSLQYEKDKDKEDRKTKNKEINLQADKLDFEKQKALRDEKDKKMSRIVDIINDMTENIGLLNPNIPADKVKIEKLEKIISDYNKLYMKYLKEEETPTERTTTTTETATETDYNF